METLTQMVISLLLLTAAVCVLSARTRAHIREHIGDEPL